MVSPTAVGRVNWTVAPCPGADSTPIRPPWRSTIFFASARPVAVTYATGAAAQARPRAARGPGPYP